MSTNQWLARGFCDTDNSICVVFSRGEKTPNIVLSEDVLQIHEIPVRLELEIGAEVITLHCGRVTGNNRQLLVNKQSPERGSGFGEWICYPTASFSPRSPCENPKYPTT